MADTSRGDPTAETLKRRALIRLTVAGAITLAALLGLWWLDQSSTPPPERKPAPPAPIVTAPEPAPPDEPQVPETSPEAEEATPRTEPLPAPPPPRVDNLSPTPSTTPPAAVTRPAAPPRPILSEAKTEPSAPAPAAPAGPGERGYVLQLGVFSNPDNAKQLLQRLSREGIRAYSETRVQVGPFQSREEAEKARMTLERLGILAVIAPQGATR